MDDYKSFQIEFEMLKKDHYEECMKLQTKLFYLSEQKHTIDKIGMGYNKQTTFSKKTKFASSKRVNPNKVSKKKNIVHSNFSLLWLRTSKILGWGQLISAKFYFFWD